MNMDKNIQEIPIEEIIPNRFQPRLTFNEEGLNELSDSIKQHGIIQPLVVRKLGDKYEIIAGERRYKAAVQAGLTTVPVIVSDIDDNKSAEVALVENIQRRNLTAIEEAKSYKNLLDRGYLTQEQLASKMGVSQSAIANKLRLLNLDPEVQEALLNEKISERHARALLTLDNPEDQKKWLKKIIDERMTVRQLDMELKKLKTGESEEETEIPLVNINPDIDNILNNAEDINVVRPPHDVASMLMEDPHSKPAPEPAPPVDEEPKKMPNKFFNFLEDEQANMDIGETDDIFNSINNMNIADVLPSSPTNTQPVEPPLPSVPPVTEAPKEPVLTQVEVLDELDSNDEKVDTLEEEPKEEVLNDDPFENIFGPMPPKTETPKSETIINPFPVIKDKNLVDPMDSVVTLEPDYEQKQEELAGTDLKSAINIVRDTIDVLNQKGFIIEIEEADLEDIYQITIKIKKD